ncbi:MAG: hypothetical protein MRY59_10200, partial [Aquisalinus sp.]|nr:hypothetical protein [Aquisalinus sp.]
SNQRTHSGQIYSLVDLTTLPPLHIRAIATAGRKRARFICKPGDPRKRPADNGLFFSHFFLGSCRRYA